jgi:hypothetical protein
MTATHIAGMHGLGDGLHQRAIVREFLARGPVWLETPWPCLYRDMPDLHLVGKGSSLRTQAKNAMREVSRFTSAPVPLDARPVRVWYTPAAVRRAGSVLEAMAQGCGVPAGDFRFPVPPAWRRRAADLVAGWRFAKPIMIYRPLVERQEWGGCRARNPDHEAYGRLFDSIRDRYFVVSVADLEPGQEWTVGRQIEADIEFHRGELDIELLAGLMAFSSLVYSSPGFAVVLAQAIGTPAVSVFGGYEDSRSFSWGARYSPYLGIDPIEPCQCFSHSHACKKAIDLGAAEARLLEFVNAHYPQSVVLEY